MLKAGFPRVARAAAAVVLAACFALPGSAQKAHDDPFGFLAPWVVVSDADRQRLNGGEVVARILRGEGGQLAVLAMTRLNAPPDALAAWTRQIAALKQSRFVLAIGRFSDPPTVADLNGLTLDERDLDGIRRCVPGDCALKLSAPEIESLRKVPSDARGWEAAIQTEFRRLLVARVTRYRAGGLAALPPGADRSKPRRLDETFAAILDDSPYLARLPIGAAWLRAFPDAGNTGVESFFYWSKEYYGSGKPVVSVTHVGILHPESNGPVPAVLVMGKQIFASHYANGALGLTLVVRDASTGAAYLVYLNRSQLDVLKGFFAPFVRGVLESRLNDRAPQLVHGLRSRIESGSPPVGPSATPSRAR